MRTLRKCIAVTSCYAFLASSLGAQQALEPPKNPAPVIVRPYQARQAPPVRIANSGRLQQLIRGNTLYLTAQDAIALALENNIDLEVARYNPILAQWNLERSEAGGALPGVPSGAGQVGSVASGQGVAGSQAAAGVGGGGGGGGGGGVGNATISQVGPVTQNLDPSFQQSSVFSHTTAPQPNVTQSSTAALISSTKSFSDSVQQGFLSGGTVTLNYADHYLRENAQTDILNPSSAPSLTLSFQHNLLRGFGIAVNDRTIRVNKINLQTSDLNFKTQVISTVAGVLNRYYALAADYEDLRAKQSALDTAQDLYKNTLREQELGAMSSLDVNAAESQVATSQGNLVVSQTTLRQDELQLKNLLSRTGPGDPVMAPLRIMPLDRIVVPSQDDLPPLDELVAQAMRDRPDLALQRANVQIAEVNALGTRNGVLPPVQTFGNLSQAGLAGAPVVGGRTSTPPNAYFVGGIGTALGQVFRRNFPSERIGVFLNAPLRNRQAQADEGIDQLSLRQTQLTTEKALSQVVVDVSNYAIAVQQARARYQAAVQNRILEEQLVAAEQKKLTLGASTPYNVVLQQRDLAAAQATEVSSMSAYMRARIALDQAVGATLEANHVDLGEAREGHVARTSAAPANP